MRTPMAGAVLAVAVALVGAPAVAPALTMDWVLVGDPGNAPDATPGTQNCGPNRDQPCGAVSYGYKIGKYEVTKAQYAEFLNAVDPTGANTLGLFHPIMETDALGGFVFDAGAPDGSKYAVASGLEATPVVFVNWYSAIRMANWMHNGMGSGGTESGAYTLLGGTPTPSNAGAIVRDPGAAVWLPSEDEWYKAAYYDVVSNTYLSFPFDDAAGTVACEAPPGATAHSANCGNVVGAPTDVGAYAGSPGPNGTFDQAGNVFELTESEFASTIGDFRVQRGGYFGSSGFMSSGESGSTGEATRQSATGFRLATLPEPGTALMVGLGLAGLGVRRRRAAARARAA